MQVSESPIFRLLLSDLTTDEYSQLLNRLANSTEKFVEFRTFKEDHHVPFNAYKQSPFNNELCRNLCDNNFKV